MAKRKKEPEFKFGPNDKLTSAEKTLFRKSKQWIEFRNKAIKERGNKCELCGYEKRNTLHHIYLNDSAKSYTDLRIERFKVLCMGCHKFCHRVERTLHRKKNPPTPDSRMASIIDEFIILDEGTDSSSSE